MNATSARSARSISGAACQDATYAEQLHRYHESNKGWVEPSVTGHLWRARLPEDLGSGTYTLTVKGTDQYGAEFTAHKILEIVGHGSEG